MSFGNRSSYASLKDAFGVTEFEKTVETSYTIEKQSVAPATPTETIENFSESDISCNQVKSHCESCGCMEKSRSWINEILNLLLIGLLLWILVYKPAN